jgi:hypothetical protein
MSGPNRSACSAVVTGTLAAVSLAFTVGSIVGYSLQTSQTLQRLLRISPPSSSSTKTSSSSKTTNTASKETLQASTSTTTLKKLHDHNTQTQTDRHTIATNNIKSALDTKAEISVESTPYIPPTDLSRSLISLPVVQKLLNLPNYPPASPFEEKTAVAILTFRPYQVPLGGTKEEASKERSQMLGRLEVAMAPEIITKEGQVTDEHGEYDASPTTQNRALEELLQQTLRERPEMYESHLLRGSALYGKGRIEYAVGMWFPQEKMVVKITRLGEKLCGHPGMFMNDKGKQNAQGTHR